jgi:hypothetical protein
MSNQFNLPSSRFVLPTITTLLGLTGLTTGLLTVLSANPIDAVRPFGLRPAASNVTRDNNPFTRALVYTYATRNIGGALTTLGLTTFWQMQPTNSIAATTARSCLGLSMLLGTVVAVGDAVLVSKFAEDVGGEVGEEAKIGSTGHAVAAVLIAITGGALLWV